MVTDMADNQIYGPLNGGDTPDTQTGMLSSVRDEARGTPGTKSVSGVVSSGASNVAGMVASRVTGIPEAGTAVTGLMKGKAPESVAVDAAVSGVKRAAVEEAVKAGVSPGIAAPVGGYLASTGMNISKEMNAPNPNMAYGFAKAAPGAAGAMLGGIFGPAGMVVGGILGGLFGASSFNDGFLGDITDSRDQEGMLEELQGMGYSREEAASIRDTESDVTDQYDPTGRDHYSPESRTDGWGTEAMSGITMDAWGNANDAQAAENEAQGGDMGTDTDNDGPGDSDSGGVGGR